MTKFNLSAYKKIVIKIGSALLVNPKTGLNSNWLFSIASDIAKLKKNGSDVLVVSSGAIALGRTTYNLPQRELRLEESQAAASIGQIALARAWSSALSQQKLQAGQLLLTLSDTEQRRRYLNARATVNELLKWNAIPIINENDTVATTEIRYGDNDRLAARVATMVGADLLILLSDIDGLYSAPPAHNKNAEHISEIKNITPEIEAMAGKNNSLHSRGGMKTKIEAAKIATTAGCAMIIASGKIECPIEAIKNGARHSYFHPTGTPTSARKIWIAGQLEPTGKIVIDAGAASALKNGNSLLPAGTTSLSGNFARGDTVAIFNHDGIEIARGLTAYDANIASKILGKKSTEIEKILGYSGRTVMVHRDDMVLIGANEKESFHASR